MALLLPLNGAGAVLQVDRADATVDGLLRVLRAEAAPIAAWQRAAEHLLASGQEAEFEAVLQEGVDRAAQPGQAHRDVFGQIQALCCLAELKLQQAAATTDRRQRLLLHSNATELCHRAQRLNMEEQLPDLVLGVVALAKGDPAAAQRSFEKASRMRCNGRACVAPLLALAALQFNRRDYGGALRLYKRALRQCPSCPPEVRLGIAACCLKLGSTDKAEAAYRRTLALDPGCTPALLGLAVLRLHVAADEAGVREGSRLLAQAFAQDPQNPFVLLLLAHFCLRQGLPDKARQLAQAVQQQGGAPAVQAEAYTLLGRAQHALGQMGEAYRCYQQANQLDPKAPLPRLGLAQASVLMGEPRNAVSMLEALAADAPQWTDALQVLGAVYRRVGSRGAKALPQLKAAAAARPGDAALWELLGDVLAPLEPAGALKAYDTAIELRRAAAKAARAAGEAPPPPPPRLLNNAAVLRLRAGDAQRAFALTSEAVAAAAAGGGGADITPLTQITLAYNRARVEEACGNLKGAEREYRTILEQFPRYGDCCLRLACISRARGGTKEALGWARQAEGNPAYRDDALAFQAGLLLERRDYHAAKGVIDRLLEGGDRSFGQLAMANLHAYSAPSDRRKEEGARRAEGHYSHALELYRRVLERDDGCIFAANGVGCILAECGHLAAAKEIFLQVQEAAAASDGFWRMPDAWVNLASVYLAQEQYGPAIQMYRNALRRFYHNRSAVVMLYLARAQYDADQLPEARRTLTRALHLAPTDLQLRFDVALTMQEWAVRLVNKPRPASDPGAAAEARAAVRDLLNAHRFFSHLAGLGAGHGLDVRKVKEHVAFVADAHNKALTHMQRAEAGAVAAEARAAAAAKAKDAAELSRRLAEERRQAEDAVAAAKRQERAQQSADRLAQLREQWRTAATVAKAVQRGDASAVAKSAQLEAEAAKNAQVDALFASESEDEDYNPELDEEGRAAAAADAAAAKRRPPGAGAPAAGGAPADAPAGAGAGADAAADLFGDLEDEFDSDFDIDEGAEAGGGGGGGGGGDDGGSGGGAQAAPPPSAGKKRKHAAVLSDSEGDE